MSGHKIYKEDIKPLLDYIDDQWSVLLNSHKQNHTTLIPLPNQYITPSSDEGYFRFDEQYYWDSYFTALGLDDEKLVSGMLDNLIHQYKLFGLIPNANRYYFTGRSQPPILTSFILHVYEKYKKPKSWLKTHIKIAIDEYETVWTNDSHPHNRKVYRGLSRYYDINILHDLAEAESGWDMTNRFDRRCLDFLPIDLNCLLYKYEKDIAKSLELLNDESAKAWRKRASKRRHMVTELMWDERAGMFYDYDYFNDRKSKIESLAAYYALWSGLATTSQAEKLIQNLKKFIKPGGLVTTLPTKQTSTESQKTQWAYPNGWAPLQIIVADGLDNYGHTDEASHISKLWITTVNSWFTKNNEILEKYNVVYPKLPPMNGVYPTQKGFAWTNASVVYLLERYLSTDL